MSILAKKLQCSDATASTVTIADTAGQVWYYYTGANQISYSFSADYTDAGTGKTVLPVIVLWARTNEVTNPYVVSVSSTDNNSNALTFNLDTSSTVWNDGAGYYDIFEVWVCTEEIDVSSATSVSFIVTWYSTTDMNTFQATAIGVLDPDYVGGSIIKDSGSNATTGGITLNGVVGGNILCFGFWANSSDTPNSLTNLYSLQVTDIETTDYLHVAALGDVYGDDGSNLNSGDFQIDDVTGVETVNINNTASVSRHLFAFSLN